MSEQQRACRSCDADGLITIIDLGETPLANALLTASQLSQPEARYPLELSSARFAHLYRSQRQ